MNNPVEKLLKMMIIFLSVIIDEDEYGSRQKNRTSAKINMLDSILKIILF